MRLKSAAPRRGQTILVVVLVVTAILTVFVVMRSDFRRHAHKETVRALAGQVALWTAQSMAESAVSDLMRAAGDPSAAKYRDVRKRMVAATGAVDLTDLLEPPLKLPPAFRWAGPRRAEGPIGAVKLERVTAHVESLAGFPRPDGSPAGMEDERTGILVVQAAASATVGGVEVKRTISECRELKLVLAGPPRPFDAVGLYFGELSGLTDAARANRARAKVFSHMDWAVNRLSNLPPGMSDRTRQRLLAISAGLPNGAGRESGMPPLPEVSAAVVQVADPHSRKLDLARLDLASVLEADVAKIAESRATIDSGLSNPDPARADDLVDKATYLARLFNQALMHGWFYQKQFRIVPRTDDAFTQGIAPYEERLATAWYRPRTVHRLDPADEVYRDWRAGKRQLTGVFELPGSARFELSGPVSGRLVLVLGDRDVTLRDVTAGQPGEHLTVVLESGRLQLGGTVHASLILGDRVTLAMDSATTLAGTLTWAHPPGRPALAGTLDADGHAMAGDSPVQASGWSGFGVFALGLSPAPIWTEGDRQ